MDFKQRSHEQTIYIVNLFIVMLISHCS